MHELEKFSVRKPSLLNVSFFGREKIYRLPASKKYPPLGDSDSPLPQRVSQLLRRAWKNRFVLPNYAIFIEFTVVHKYLESTNSPRIIPVALLSAFGVRRGPERFVTLAYCPKSSKFTPSIAKNGIYEQCIFFGSCTFEKQNQSQTRSLLRHLHYVMRFYCRISSCLANNIMGDYSDKCFSGMICWTSSWFALCRVL